MSGVFTKSELAAVNKFAEVLREKANTLGYGVQADSLLDRALATFGQHESHEAATEYAARYATAVFNEGVYNLTQAGVAEKVREVFAAGWDAAVDHFDVDTDA